MYASWKYRSTFGKKGGYNVLRKSNWHITIELMLICVLQFSSFLHSADNIEKHRDYWCYNCHLSEHLPSNVSLQQVCSSFKFIFSTICFL